MNHEDHRASEETEASKRATDRPQNEYGLGYPLERTALLVIDPVNDFLSEGGAAWNLTKNFLKAHDVVGNIRRAMNGARKSGVPVIFAPMAYTQEDYAEKQLHRKTGINRVIFEMKMFLAGSWGADFHPELQPLADEIVLLPHKGTDVFETDLPGHLWRLGTTHLVIAGMTADICCGSTGRRAAEIGYDVTYLWDAIGAGNIASYQASMTFHFPLIGNGIVTVNEFLDALSRPAAGEVQAGDKVCGSDRLEIGTVRDVVAADSETEAYMVVLHGLIFPNDLCIPLDAVVRRVGDQVFVNVPKLVISEMPWDKPPVKSERIERYGMPEAQVKKVYGSHSPYAHGQVSAKDLR